MVLIFSLTEQCFFVTVVRGDESSSSDDEESPSTPCIKVCGFFICYHV